MKTLSILGAGIALTSLLVSCNNEDMLQGSKTDKLNTLTAYIEEGPADSRVTIDGEGTFTWETGDKIAVYSETSQKFEDWTYESYDATTYLTTFTSDATASDEAYAVFPNSLNPQITDDELQVTLPASYDTNKTAPILTGKCQDGEVGFAHAGGLIRISFENVPSYVTKFELKTNNQNIAGTFTVKDKAITTSEGDNNSVTIAINKDDGADHSTFDVPVPVGTYSGFTINLYYDNEIVYTKSTSEGNNYTINRRDLVVMPTITLPENYVIETIVPEHTDMATQILGCTEMEQNFIMMGDQMAIPDGIFQMISQVKEMYIDDVKLDEPIYYYTFSDKNEHNVKIVFNENFSTAAHLFYFVLYATQIDISSLDTHGITDMQRMFGRCEALQSIDVSGIDTRKVTDMSYLFEECNKLTSIKGLDKFNTSNVTNMEGMFKGCSQFTSFDDIANYDTSKVENMSFMFYCCRNLESIPVLNTSSVTNLNYALAVCESLKSIDLTKYDTSKVETMEYLFSNCISLTELDFTGFKAENTTRMGGMFAGCTGLTSLDLSKISTPNLISLSSMFCGCTNLEKLDISGLNTSKVIDMNSTFAYCTKLKEIDLSTYGIGSAVYIQSTFQNCTGLEKIKLSGNPTSLGYIGQIFSSMSDSGILYYPTEYKDSYKNIIDALPSGWTAADLSTAN
jgi:surface protein